MSYLLCENLTIYMPKRSQNGIFDEFMTNFTYGKKWNIVYNLEDTVITIGNFTKADRGNDEFVLKKDAVDSLYCLRHSLSYITVMY